MPLLFHVHHSRVCHIVLAMQLMLACGKCAADGAITPGIQFITYNGTNHLWGGDPPRRSLGTLFPDTRVGTSSTLTIEVRNAYGDKPTTLTSVTIENDPSSSFKVLFYPTDAIAYEAHRIHVVFEPISAGVHSAKVRVTAHDGSFQGIGIGGTAWQGPKTPAVPDLKLGIVSQPPYFLYRGSDRGLSLRITNFGTRRTGSGHIRVDGSYVPYINEDLLPGGKCRVRSIAPGETLDLVLPMNQLPPNIPFSMFWFFFRFEPNDDDYEDLNWADNYARVSSHQEAWPARLYLRPVETEISFRENSRGKPIQLESGLWHTDWRGRTHNELSLLVSDWMHGLRPQPVLVQMGTMHWTNEILLHEITDKITHKRSTTIDPVTGRPEFIYPGKATYQRMTIPWTYANYSRGGGVVADAHSADPDGVITGSADFTTTVSMQTPFSRTEPMFISHRNVPYTGSLHTSDNAETANPTRIFQARSSSE